MALTAQAPCSYDIEIQHDTALDGYIDAPYALRAKRQHRDDMGGVGSFNDRCCTLFVGDLMFQREAPNAVEMVLHEIEAWILLKIHLDPVKSN